MQTNRAVERGKEREREKERGTAEKNCPYVDLYSHTRRSLYTPTIE